MKKGQKQQGDACIICGQNISKYTAAKASHMRKHVRDGSLKEIKDKDGRFQWRATGKEPIKLEKPPKPPKKNTYEATFTLFHAKKFDPRTPIAAKLNSKNNMIIKCRKCGKWIKNPIQFADPRFLCITHCDTISLFPKRVQLVPGREYRE